MWFKQCRFYQLLEKIPYDAETLEASLLTAEFKPCSALAPVSLGFVPMLDGEDSPLVYAANGFLGMCLRIEERLLPSAVIKDAVDERVKQIQIKEARRVGRKERLTIKDETYIQLLPKAFKRSTYIHAFIDTHHQRLFINCATPSKVEHFTNTLRKAMGSLKIAFPDIVRPARTMTRWVIENTINEEWLIEDSCLLQRSQDEKAKIRLQKQDLFSETVRAHIDDGHEVTQLALTWKEQLRFSLKDDLGFSNIQYLEFIETQRKEYLEEEPAVVFDADFALETALLSDCVQMLMTLLEASGAKVVKHQADVPVGNESEAACVTA